MKPSVRLTVTLLASLTLLSVACTPPTSPTPTTSPPPLVRPTLPATTTTTLPPPAKPTLPSITTTTAAPLATTTTTTQPPHVCPSTSTGTSLPEDPPTPGLAPSEVTEQTTTAVQEAAAADQNVVVVSSHNGQPDVVSVEPEAAAATVAALADVSDVVSVSPDVPVTILDDPVSPPSTLSSPDPLFSSQWSFSKFDFQSLWQCSSGSDVTVAVVDTGVLASHPDLTPRVSTGFAQVSGPAQPGLGGVDQHGHGTHVAGIIAASFSNGQGITGVAPQVDIMPIRVLDSSGSGYTSDIIAGMYWAVDNGADILNMSLGTSSNVPAFSTAVDYAVAHGVVVVAAAGNAGPTGSPLYPAAYPNTIAVAALNSNLTLASYSTNGSYVDVAAPGSIILSTVSFYNSSTGTYTSGYQTMSGTSMASPHVAALVALIEATNPPLSPTAVKDRLTSTAVDAGPAGKDNGYGYGYINLWPALTGS